MSGPKEETKIVARCLQALVLHKPRARFWRSNSGSGGKKNGKHKCNSINLVDIVGWQANGMALAVEVKTAEGELTFEQFEFLRDVHERGGYAAVFGPTKKYALEDFFPFGSIPRQFLPSEIRQLGKEG